MEIKVSLSNDSKYIQNIELVYPEKTFQFEKNNELQSETIKIGEEEYLKRIVYRTDKNNFITSIEFAMKNEDNNLRVEVFGKDFNPENK